MPTPVRHGVVEEARDEVPALARHRDASRRRVRRDDLGAHRLRRRDHALPVRPGDDHAELVGRRDEARLERAALGPGLAVAAARDEGGAHAALRAGAQQLLVRLVRRADEDEVGLALGHLRDVAERRLAEHLGAVAVHREERARGSRSGAGCGARRSRTCPGGSTRPATTTPRGWKSGRSRSSSSASLRAGARGRRAAPAAPSSTRASTATRPAARDDERIQVDARDVGPLLGEARRGRASTSASASASTAGSPRKARVSRCAARSRPGRRRGLLAREAAPPRTRRRRAPRSGCPRGRAARRDRSSDRARGPRSARAARAPSRRRAARRRRPRAARVARSSAPALAHRGGVGEPEPHEVALGLVGDRVAAELERDREAERRRGRAPRPPALAASRSRGNGTP